MDPAAAFMYDLRPCCNGVDAKVDFRRFGAGLVGSGGTCSICLEVDLILEVLEEDGSINFSYLLSVIRNGPGSYSHFPYSRGALAHFKSMSNIIRM